jgi:glycosyltransferase involved in cell wall biosynthesis
LENIRKILAWSDSASTSTGFGIVSKNILSYLYKTGKYEIHQLAINYPARFKLVDNIPWLQISAKSLDPEDPYGKILFLRSIAEGDYDIVWIMNDTYVVYDVVSDLKKIFDKRRAAGKKIPKVVYYYPVDCCIHKKAGSMIDFADAAVCYNDFGRQETLKEMSEMDGRLQQIPHGVDTQVFYPFSYELQQRLKEKFLGGAAHKFAFLNVNRNSDRKQLARCIYAFSEFHKQVPNSVLMLHTQPVDKNMNRTIDLIPVVKQLNLSLEQDVLFPPNYEPSRAYPESIMNELYNAADCFITTHCGEGWGVSVHESLSAGTPVIAPKNSAMPQMLGDCSERGYLYEMKDFIYIDNSALRPIGYTEDVVLEMFKVFRAGPKHLNPKVRLARQWAEEYDWRNICPQWDSLFEELINRREAMPLEGNILQVERI